MRSSPFFSAWQIISVGLFAGLVGAFSQSQYQLLSHYETQQLAAHDLALKIRSNTSEGRVLGAAQLMGSTSETALLALSRGSKQDLERLDANNQHIVKQFSADNAYVLSADGKVISYIDAHGTSNYAGKTIGNHPYWNLIQQGQSIVYPAIGSSSQLRGIYFAAPIRDPSSPNKVVGTYIIKMGGDFIDSLLQDRNLQAWIVSPDGIIFGSNEPKALFQTVTPLDQTSISALKATDQFKPLFDAGKVPTAVGIRSVSHHEVDFQHKNYLLSSSGLDWPDRRGQWQVIVLQSVDQLISLPQILLTGLICFGLVTGLGFFIRVRSKVAALYEENINQALAAAEKIKTSEEAFRTLAENSADVIFRFDTELKLIYASPAFFVQMDSEPFEIRGHNLQEVGFTDAEAHEREAILKEVIRSGTSHRAIFQQGKQLNWREWLLSPEFDASQQVHSVLVTSRDISEQLEHQRALQVAVEMAQMAKQQIVDLSNTLPLAVFQFVSTKQQEYYSFLSEQIVDLFGIQASEIIENPALLWTYVPQLEMQKARNEFKNAIAERRTATLEFPVIRDGEIRTIKTVGVPALSDNEHCYWNGFFMDVTESHELENSLRKAKLRAEEATEAKSRFLANMSHEIRTPMNAIIGLSHLALRHVENERQRDYLEKIKHSGLALLELINDILDFSKIEANSLALEHTEFSINDVLTHVATVTASKATDKNLRYLFKISPILPEQLLGDPLRLGQVLINLLNNAIKFTAEGTITLSLFPSNRAHNHVTIDFSVTDSGIGMTDVQCTQLFKPFTQADSSTTRQFGGTGLGLSISQRIVNLMGGEITAKSVVNKGSCFNFTIQFDTPPAPKAIHCIQTKKLNSSLLLITQHSDSIEEVSFIAKEFGISVRHAQDIKTASTTFAHQPTELVFIELDKDAETVVQQVSSMRLDKNCQIVFFGIISAELFELATKLGFKHLFPQPLYPASWRLILTELFSSEFAVKDQPNQEYIPQFASGRVLIVEDNPINQQIVSELISSTGLSVEIANDGQFAVEMLMAAPDGYFGLVCMDLQMPRLDGYAATRQLRSIPRFEKLPIVAMTANAATEDRDQALQAGMNAHIAKPIDPKLLYELLSKYFVTSLEKQSLLGTMAENSNPREPNPTNWGSIDYQEALIRLGNKQTTLNNLLRQFHFGYANYAEQIRKAITANDQDTAIRLAHTIKGVGGNLGMASIAHTAGSIEQHLRDNVDGKTSLESLLGTLTDQISEVCEIIDLQLQPDSKEEIRPTDFADVNNEIDLLMIFLESNDRRATQQFQKLQSYLQAQNGNSFVIAIERLLDQYAFSEAAQLLRESNLI